MAFVELKHVTKRFKDEEVLKDISLTIPQGELFGLLGPSGSGKTTLIKMMLGLLQPTSGTAIIENTTMPSLKQMRTIGYMAQSDALYNDLTARENLLFFASIYGIRKSRRKRRVAEIAQMVDLTDHLDKLLATFSGGMLRRMSLAAALMHYPKLLVLDEPTVGIDPVLRASIWRDLKDLQSQGTTIIMTTHVMDEAEKCDRLAMLRDGRIIAQGSPDQLQSESHANSLEEAFLYYGQHGTSRRMM